MKPFFFNLKVFVFSSGFKENEKVVCPQHRASSPDGQIGLGFWRPWLRDGLSRACSRTRRHGDPEESHLSGSAPGGTHCRFCCPREKIFFMRLQPAQGAEDCSEKACISVLLSEELPTEPACGDWAIARRMRGAAGLRGAGLDLRARVNGTGALAGVPGAEGRLLPGSADITSGKWPV